MGKRAGGARPFVVDRSALIERVVGHAPACTLIVAPAGYGKSRFARFVAEGFGRAAFCDVAAASADQLSRRILLALAGAGDETDAGLAKTIAAFGASSGVEYSQLLDLAWTRKNGPRALVLENVERIAADQTLIDLICRLAVLQNGPRLIICSRTVFESAALRRLPPNELVRIGVDELQFSDRETRSLFDPAHAGEELISRAVLQAGGWPIAALVLARAAEAGTLEAALAMAGSFATMMEYVTTQAFEGLDERARDLLGAISRISPASAADMEALGTSAERVRSLCGNHPFFVEADAAIVTHPLAQRALDESGHGKRVLLEAAVRIEASDPLASARFYVAAGAQSEAARLVGTALAPFLTGEVPLRLAEVVAAIDRDVLLGDAQAWAATTLLRVFALTAHERLEEARRVWQSLAADAPLPLRISVGTVLYNHAMFLNELAEGTEVMRELERALDAEPADFVWRGIVETWAAWAAMRAGRSIDVADLRKRSTAFLAVPSTSAVFIYEFDARAPVMLLDRDTARCLFDKALELIRTTDSAVYHVIIGIGAAFFAWLAGEDALYRRYLEYVQADAGPAVLGGASYFLDCCTGNPIEAVPRNEIRYQRVYAAIIGASRCAKERDRQEMAALALTAAIDDGQPMSLALAWLTVAFTSPQRRAEAFAKARSFAAQVEGGAWTSAIDALEKNDGPLLAFRERFIARGPEEPAIVVRYARRSIGGRSPSAPLTGREFAVVVALASLARAVDSIQLATMLFPDDDLQAALKAVRVWVSRVRAKFPGFEIIRSVGNAYQLTTGVKLDVHVAEEALRASRGAPALTNAQRADLEAIVEDGAYASATYLPDVAWAAALERRYHDVRRRACLVLARDAQRSGDEQRVETLLSELFAEDPLDEEAAVMLAGLYAGQGKGADAERVRRKHERAVASG